MQDLTDFLNQFKQGRAKFLPKTEFAKLPALYSQETVKDPVAPIKFFDPYGSWRWYVLEAQVERDEDGNIEDITFFGLVDGFERELGYFSFKELTSLSFGYSRALRIERDQHWTPKPLSACT